MPPEPKKPIEELLEASARARRAEFGTDQKMPNPMRARLHDEIARLGREEQPERRRSWLAMFWPQVSIAAAVTAVLITASVMWLGHRSNSGGESLQLAMRAPAEPQADAMLKSLDAPNQVTAETEAVPEKNFIDGALASDSLADNTAASKPADVETRAETDSALQTFADASTARTAPAVEPGAADDQAKDGEERTRVASRADETGQASAAARVPSDEKFATAAQAPAAAPLATNQKKRAANLQEQFSQTARGQALRSNSKLNQAANILDTFQVEQDGHEIRVVDADGSTYTGKLEPVARSAAARMSKETQPAPAPTNELFFRATGFNASLKKRVVFEGNYIPMPAEEKKKASAGAKSDSAQQVPARIVGQARVPGESPVEVDAASVTR